jgi:DNA-binding transcriptional LysR family regulator
MDVGFARLRAFSETARVGSMTAAAAALGYSVGAVSQQVSALEREVGRPLFDRIGRGLQLTEAGTLFLQYADDILLSQAAAAGALSDPWQADRAVPVRLGVFGSLAAVALGPAVAALAERAPNVVVRSVELDVDDVADAVRRAAVDVAFGIDYATSRAPTAEGVQRSVLATEPMQLAVRADDPRQDVVDLAACSSDAWIAAPADTHFGQVVRSMCRSEGFEPPVVHTVADTGACLAMAASGLGVTPATRMMYEVRPAGLRLVALRPVATRDIVLLTPARRSPSPLRELLIDVLRQVVAPYHDAMVGSGR